MIRTNTLTNIHRTFNPPYPDQCSAPTVEIVLTLCVYSNTSGICDFIKLLHFADTARTAGGWFTGSAQRATVH